MDLIDQILKAEKQAVETIAQTKEEYQSVLAKKKALIEQDFQKKRELLEKKYAQQLISYRNSLDQENKQDLKKLALELEQYRLTTSNIVALKKKVLVELI